MQVGRILYWWPVSRLVQMKEYVLVTWPIVAALLARSCVLFFRHCVEYAACPYHLTSATSIAGRRCRIFLMTFIISLLHSLWALALSITDFLHHRRGPLGAWPTTTRHAIGAIAACGRTGQH